MRCLVFAYSEIGVESLQTLLDLGETVAGVVTHADDPAEKRWFRSVEELALKQGIPVITPENPNTPEVLAWAKERRPDILFSFYYRRMLKKPWLELPPLGAFNLHGSLLPKFRGRAPINWAIIEGATETGLTLHGMVERPDAGEIVAQESVAIAENDTVRDVYDKLVPLARVLLTSAVPLLSAGKAPRRAQNESEATYFGGRKPEDGRLDWSWPARRIHNMVRALTRPFPGAFTFLGGRKLLIWKGFVIPETSESQAGQVLRLDSKGASVATGDGVYVIKELGWESEPAQPAHQVLKENDHLLSAP